MTQPLAHLDARASHPAAHRALDPERFKALFRGHPGGVAVITADAGGGPVALTATSVSSVNVEPPLLVFSISSLSSASATLQKARSIVVHLLGADDLDIAKLGATSGIDRFADTSRWRRLSTGEPFFPEVRAWVRCVVIERMRAGSSTVIAAHGVEARMRAASHEHNDEHGDALVYHNRGWHRLSAQTRLG